MLSLVQTYISAFLCKRHLKCKNLFVVSTSMKKYQKKFDNSYQLLTSVIHCHGKNIKLFREKSN